MGHLSLLQDTLKLEAESLIKAAERLTEEQASKLESFFQGIIKDQAQLAFCGVGKSGIIAQKLAATFSSIGLPSFFLHPTEALHGDLGRVRKMDRIVLISKSGRTQEIMALIPFLPVSQEGILGLLGDIKGPLAKSCHLVLDCSVDKEACLTGQAPTTSSTLALAMGDSLAVVFEKMINLSKESFAQNHPGGMLGRLLHHRVSELMLKKDDCPYVSTKSTLKEGLEAMTKMPIGGLAIVDGTTFKGLIVEGDIRRSLLTEGLDLRSSITKLMNSNPISLRPQTLASDALEVMEKRERPLNIVPVLSEEGEFLGLIRAHDLLGA